jgi:hypothetical protein
MTTIVTVDDYIGTQAAPAQSGLRELLAIIRAAAPRQRLSTTAGRAEHRSPDSAQTAADPPLTPAPPGTRTHARAVARG